MAIVPLFQHAAFDPEATHAMGEAFDLACRHLLKTSRTELVREIIAAVVIEFARRGERRPEVLLRHAWEDRRQVAPRLGKAETLGVRLVTNDDTLGSVR